MKNIIILGKNSYLGESLYRWLQQYPDKYNVDIISTINYEWKKTDYSQYDTLVDFAGIAHINNITPDMKELFYSVNRDLTIEIGDFAKKHGIKHMIYFSSMNVYGDYCCNLKNRENVNPTSFYGDSKLQGDLGLDKLEDNSFHVAHIRPPFVYGKGCSGNYNSVSKIAKKLPVFPRYDNKKSMIYIDNLCEFVRLVIDTESYGIMTPQNKELVSTADLIKEISTTVKHGIWITRLFNWCIPLGMKISKQIRKAFINDFYELEMSDYFEFKYCIVDFKTSIKRTEL